VVEEEEEPLPSFALRLPLPGIGVVSVQDLDSLKEYLAISADLFVAGSYECKLLANSYLQRKLKTAIRALEVATRPPEGLAAAASPQFNVGDVAKCYIPELRAKVLVIIDKLVGAPSYAYVTSIHTNFSCVVYVSQLSTYIEDDDDPLLLHNDLSSNTRRPDPPLPPIPPPPPADPETPEQPWLEAYAKAEEALLEQLYKVLGPSFRLPHTMPPARNTGFWLKFKGATRRSEFRKHDYIVMYTRFFTRECLEAPPSPPSIGDGDEASSSSGAVQETKDEPAAVAETKAEANDVEAKSAFDDLSALGKALPPLSVPPVIVADAVAVAAGVSQPSGPHPLFPPDFLSKHKFATMETNRCFFLHLGIMAGVHPFALQASFRREARRQLDELDAAPPTNDDWEMAKREAKRWALESLWGRSEYVDAQVLQYVWPAEFDDVRILIVPMVNYDLDRDCGDIKTLYLYTPRDVQRKYTNSNNEWIGRDMIVAHYLGHFTLLIPDAAAEAKAAAKEAAKAAKAATAAAKGEKVAEKDSEDSDSEGEEETAEAKKGKGEEEHFEASKHPIDSFIGTQKTQTTHIFSLSLSRINVLAYTHTHTHIHTHSCSIYG